MVENEDYNDDEDNDEDEYEDFEEEDYKEGEITAAGKPFLKLIGTDGNVFSVLGKAQRVARIAKWPKEKIDEYFKKATSGDYNNALAVTMEYFDVA